MVNLSPLQKWSDEMQVDWLIKNVTVIDGSGGPDFAVTWQ